MYYSLWNFLCYNQIISYATLGLMSPGDKTYGVGPTPLENYGNKSSK